MADKSMEHDKKVLHNLGYAQELSRRMSGFSNFAISFSIICILAGGISSFAAAFNATGGGGAFVGWFVGGLFALLVSFSMGQIASAYPTAGGLYHWGSILGGKFWGWVTAWFNLLGLIFVVSSVDVYLYLVFFKGLLIDTVLGGHFLGMDASTWGIMQQHTFVILALVTQALLNHYGIKVTTMLTDLSGYLIFALTIVFIIALFAFSPVHPFDFSRLFTFTNYTGAPGGDWVPHTDSMFLAFFFGLIYVMYTITGFDASGHTSEETHDAQVNVPRGMWTSVFYSWTFGLVMVAAFILVMPNLDDAAAVPGGNSFFYMWSAVFGAESSSFAQTLGLILAIGFVIVNYICALAGLTSTSRMMYAFSRDGGLPFSGFLSHISTTTRTPTYAIWTAIVLAFLSTLYADVFLLLATGCAVFLYISYIIPVIAGFFAEGKTWNERGPFNLGAWSKPNAIIATIGVTLLTITGFVPPYERIFYLTVAMILGLLALWSKRTAVISVVASILIYIGSSVGVLSYISTTWALAYIIIAVVIGAVVWFWHGGESERFQGVPQGDKIKERQKMIADIEKRYAD